MSNSNSNTSRLQFSLRTATASDLPSCHAIYRHYALNTTIAFLLNDPPLKYISDRYHATQSHALAYLVAVAVNPRLHEPTNALSTASPHPPTSTTTTSRTEVDTSEVLGFAHDSPLSATKAGYAPSVELTLFCAPDHLGQGVGSALLTRLLNELRTCRNVHWEEGHQEQKFEMPVRNVFAVV